MILVCDVTGDENVGDYNYAVLTLDNDYIAWLKSRLVLAKQLNTEHKFFYAIEYFDYSASYFRALPDGLDVDSGDWIRIDQTTVDAFSSLEELPTNATTVAITDDSFVWKGHPKHSSGEFETASMPLEVLNALIAEEEAAQGESK